MQNYRQVRYKLKKIIGCINGLTLTKHNIQPVDQVRKKGKYELIEEVMRLQGDYNQLVNNLQNIIKEVKWGE